MLFVKIRHELNEICDVEMLFINTFGHDSPLHDVTLIEQNVDQTCYWFIHDVARQHITCGQIALSVNEDSCSITVHLRENSASVNIYISFFNLFILCKYACFFVISLFGFI